METVTREVVKVPKSAFISGLTGNEVDIEIQSHLQTNRSVNRVLHIDEPCSEFHSNAIVEFTYGTAMETLTPLQPVLLYLM